MKLAADAAAFLLLGVQDLAGEVAKISFHDARLLKQFPIMILTLCQVGVSLFQLPVELMQAAFGLAETTMRRFERREGFHEKCFRSLEEALFFSFRAGCRQACRQCAMMHPSH